MKSNLMVLVLLFASFQVFADAEQTNFFESNPCSASPWNQTEAKTKIEDLLSEGKVYVLKTRLYLRRRYCTTSDGCLPWDPPGDLGHASGNFGNSYVRIGLNDKKSAALKISGHIWTRPEWVGHQPGPQPICYIGLAPFENGFNSQPASENYRELGEVGQSSYNFKIPCGNGGTQLQFKGVVSEDCAYFKSDIKRVHGSASRWYESQWVSVSLPR